jgi:hypothetical protein
VGEKFGISTYGGETETGWNKNYFKTTRYWVFFSKDITIELGLHP